MEKKKKERAENKETESKYEVSLKRKPKVGTLKGMIKTDKPLDPRGHVWNVFVRPASS